MRSVRTYFFEETTITWEARVGGDDAVERSVSLAETLKTETNNHGCEERREEEILGRVQE